MNDEGAPFITKKYTPSASSNNQAGAGEGGKWAGEKSVRFPLVAFDDVLMSTTGFYLVKNLIPRAGLVIVWGAPKCGKSFWIFDMLMHVACG